MHNNKHLLYYSRLEKLGVKEPLFITLTDVAEALFTSTRHCRTLLKQLDDIGWVSWQPKVGRNQRSKLVLNYQLDELNASLAQDLIFSGDYEKALELIDGDKTLFGKLLKNTSGTQHREGRLHIQLTYSRAFSTLVPHIPQRNSERFLLRQIYSCLTRCDENGNVTPELAHHWFYDEKDLVWRFYLRPQLEFHDETEVTAEAVAALFTRLKDFPAQRKELSHVREVRSTNRYCIEFYLTSADPGFAGLVSGIKYSIQPVSQLSSVTIPAGTGPFRVVEHSNQKTTLAAYDNYFGYRALTDTVTIWQVEEHTDESFADTRLQANKVIKPISVCSNFLSLENGDESSSTDQQSRIEDGCLLATINHSANISFMQRRHLSQLISSEKLRSDLVQSGTKIEAITAHNLLPQWMSYHLLDSTEEPLPEKLSIAISNHHALKQCAKAISERLHHAGTHCSINEYSYEELYQRAGKGELEEDLILSSLNLDDNRPVSASCWMFSDPVLHHCLPQEQIQWLNSKLTEIREQEPTINYLKKLESVATTLISEHWLIPLFHHRQTLGFEGILKNVAINVWGWPDIRNVWAEQ